MHHRLDSWPIHLLSVPRCQSVIRCSDSRVTPPSKYDAGAVTAAIENISYSAEEGVEGAFELVHELNDQVKTGEWVGDCFLYTNNSNRLNYFVGGETMTLCHLDQEMYMLGYLPKEDRVLLIDKALNVVSYKASRHTEVNI